jgi:hypothetical protein
MVNHREKGDLFCDDIHCDKAYLARDTWALTLAGARVSGWRIYSGTLNSGDEVFWATCPEHAKTPMPQVPKVLEGQLSLFDEED